MEMVAAAKLRRYQGLLGQSRAYAAELSSIVGNLMQTNLSLRHPFFETRRVERALAILIASDSGLCGSYHVNLFETLKVFLDARLGPVSFLAVGRQGENYLKRNRHETLLSLVVPKPQEIGRAAQIISEMAGEKFMAGEIDCVFLIYTEFISSTSYRSVAEQFLPLSLERSEKKSRSLSFGYLLEPSANRVMETLIPHFFKIKIEHALKQALVAEQISRMIAMKQATENAGDMIGALTQLRNKARQSSITKELIEIVTGFRAQQES